VTPHIWTSLESVKSRIQLLISPPMGLSGAVNRQSKTPVAKPFRPRLVPLEAASIAGAQPLAANFIHGKNDESLGLRP
jgi:hypothetical protein